MNQLTHGSYKNRNVDVNGCALQRKHIKLILMIDDTLTKSWDNINLNTSLLVSSLIFLMTFLNNDEFASCISTSAMLLSKKLAQKTNTLRSKIFVISPFIQNMMLNFLL